MAASGPRQMYPTVPRFSSPCRCTHHPINRHSASERSSRAEHDRDAAIGVEEVDDGVADVLPIAGEAGPGRRHEVQQQIEKCVVGIVAQAGVEARRKVGVDRAAEGTVHAAGRIDDGVLLGDVGTRRKRRAHRRAAERRRPRDIGAVGIARIDEKTVRKALSVIEDINPDHLSADKPGPDGPLDVDPARHSHRGCPARSCSEFRFRSGRLSRRLFRSVG